MEIFFETDDSYQTVCKDTLVVRSSEAAIRKSSKGLNIYPFYSSGTNYNNNNKRKSKYPTIP